MTQLTGFSDPVYAEAYVNVNQYDIVLDVLIVNQTSDTLQACTLELATLGDLKLVEKPQVRNDSYVVIFVNKDDNFSLLFLLQMILQTSKLTLKLPLLRME